MLQAQVMKLVTTHRSKAVGGAPGFTPDSARFNLSYSTSTVSGWLNITGDPWSGVASGTQNGYTFSTLVAGNSDPTYWQWNGAGCSANITQSVDNDATTFVAELGTGYYFNSQTTYHSGGNFRITVPSSGTYTIQVWCIRPSGGDNRLVRLACIDNAGTENVTGINAAPTSTNTSNAQKRQINNAGTVVTFTGKVPNGSNYIYFGISADSGWSYGYIAAVKIVRTS